MDLCERRAARQMDQGQRRPVTNCAMTRHAILQPFRGRGENGTAEDPGTVRQRVECLDPPASAATLSVLGAT